MDCHALFGRLTHKGIARQCAQLKLISPQKATFRNPRLANGSGQPRDQRVIRFHPGMPVSLRASADIDCG